MIAFKIMLEIKFSYCLISFQRQFVFIIYLLIRIKFLSTSLFDKFSPFGSCHIVSCFFQINHNSFSILWDNLYTIFLLTFRLFSPQWCPRYHRNIRRHLNIVSPSDLCCGTRAPHQPAIHFISHRNSALHIYKLSVSVWQFVQTYNKIKLFKNKYYSKFGQNAVGSILSVCI
jgi:hypothetical protein